MSEARILVVDDERSIRRVLALYLGRLGYQIDEAEEGAEALQWIERVEGGAGYRLIISDLRMPGLGGDELFARLRQQGKGMERRLLFITGDTASDDADRILRATGAPVLLKPFDLAEVGRMVQSLLAA